MHTNHRTKQRKKPAWIFLSHKTEQLMCKSAINKWIRTALYACYNIPFHAATVKLEMHISPAKELRTVPLKRCPLNRAPWSKTTSTSTPDLTTLQTARPGGPTWTLRPAGRTKCAALVNILRALPSQGERGDQNMQCSPSLPCDVCVLTNVFMSVSVVCVYSDSA